MTRTPGSSRWASPSPAPPAGRARTGGPPAGLAAPPALGRTPRCGSPRAFRVRSWPMSRSPSPTTGSQPVAATTWVSGPSGAAVTVQAAAPVWASSRSNGRCRRGNSSLAGAPGLGQGAGQGGLLVQQLGGPVPHAAGLDQQDQGAVGAAGRRAGAPRPSATAARTPCRRRSDPPRSRSHWARPHGAAAIRASARSRTSSVGSSSRQPNSSTSATVLGRALVGDGELGEPVDLVAPQVDAHRARRRSTPNTSTIDPRTASSPRCSTWYSRR